MTLLGLSSLATVMTDEPSNWLSGRRLDRQTRLALYGQWSAAPLGPLLRQLSDQQRIAIFIDRRVDPSLPITLTANDLTWEQLLQALASDHGYGFCRLDDLYYFGPAEISLSLPGAYAKLKNQLIKRRRELKIDWSKTVPLAWPALSRPRLLLQKLAAENGIVLLHADRIPHDLWPAADLPEVPLHQQAILLALGFDKWIAISKTGARMKVVNFPATSSGSFVVAQVGDAEATAADLSSRFPQLKFRKIGKSNIQVTGGFETMLPAIQELVNRQVPLKVASSEARYTVKLKGTRGSILATVAQQLNVQLRFDRESRALLEDYIELNIVDATLEEILQRAMAGTPLEYRLDNAVLAISR